jgi:hypothetical protein
MCWLPMLLLNLKLSEMEASKDSSCKRKRKHFLLSRRLYQHYHRFLPLAQTVTFLYPDTFGAQLCFASSCLVLMFSFVSFCDF